jgi:hypothetical protein
MKRLGRYLVVALALGCTMLPVWAGSSPLMAQPVGTASQTVYVQVTNPTTSTQSGTVQVAASNPNGTANGVASVVVPPMTSAVVPVSMSGSTSNTTALSCSVTTETPEPF